MARGAGAPAREGSARSAGSAVPNGRPLGLRTHLVLLVLAVLLPALAFGAAAAWEALRRQDQAAEARLLDTARALAAAVDLHIASHISALQVLAASPDADPQADPDHFLDHARTTAAIFGGWVAAFRPDASQILNTLLPPGAPLPGPGGAIGPAGGGISVARTFETRLPVVSDVAMSPAAGRPIAFAFVPVIRNREVRSVIGMPLLPERLSAILVGQAQEGRGAAALTDGRGVFVARSREPEQVVGQPRPPRRDGGPVGESGVLRGRSLPEDVAIRTAYHRLAAAPGWHVWVNEPEASFAAARRGPLLALAGGGALALALGLLGAAVVTRRLLRPVEALVAHAEAVAGSEVQPGPSPEVPPAAVAEFERLRHAVAGAEGALRRVQRIGRVGGFDLDLRSGTTLRSAEYMAIQGRDPRPMVETHAAWLARLHPEDRERAERRYLDAIADGAPAADYEQEYRIVTPEGEVRWIYARAEIERDAQGRAVRVVGAHVDVTALKQAEAALRDREERLRLALEAARLGAWEVDLVTGTARRTPRALEIFGYGREEETATYPTWRDRIHPEDRPRLAGAVEAIRQGHATGYHLEYRFLRPDGRWIWVESHCQATGSDPPGGRPRRLIGTSQDITERKAAEERQSVLIHELDHRAKNTLAVVQAMLRLTPRQDAQVFATAVEGRVAALARAHTLLAQGRWSGAELRTVAEEALAPFLGSEGGGPRARLGGPALHLSPVAVQALTMAFHELATNAAKHGALAASGGLVTLGWHLADAPWPETLCLTWTETGGPRLERAPERRGFGSSLIAATMTRQLGGRVEADWRAEGLSWRAELPLGRVAQSGAEAARQGATGLAETAAELA